MEAKKGILLYPRKDDLKEKTVAGIIEKIKRFAESAGMNVMVFPELTFNIKLIIAIGGDGTFLDASHEAIKLDIPIAGINAGSLGFLTEIKIEEFEEVEKIISGNITIQERVVADVSVIRDQEIFRSSVVNEVFLFRHMQSPMMDYYIKYNNQELPHYKADGILVATPTGSTAYNLSINGPILFPTEHSFVVNAMAPHALTHRPLVLPSSSELEIVMKKGCNGTLTIDGRKNFEVKAEDRIIIKESAKPLKFVPNSKRNFFDILSEKLHLGRRD